MAKITTIGMYNYYSNLFDGLTFPAGIDKDIAITQILDRSSEFEILYPDPVFFSQMITFWGKKHYRTFEKWIEGLSVPFDPLYNYDRYEEYVDERLGTSATHNDRKSNLEKRRTAAQVTGNSSDMQTDTNGNRQAVNSEAVASSGETENKISAFDSSTYSPKEKAESKNGQTTNGSQVEGSSTVSNTSGKSDTATTESAVEGEGGTIQDRGGESRTEQVKHSAHLYGNIGVTTSAQLLREFLDVERWNIYEQISDLFVDEFCIMVY